MLQMQRDQLQMQLDNLPTAAEVVAQYFMDNPVLDNNLNPDYTPRATTDNDVAAGVHSTGSGTVTTSLGISVNRDFVSTIGTSKVGFTNNNRQIVAEGGGFLSSGTDATISVIRSHIQALHAEIDTNSVRPGLLRRLYSWLQRWLRRRRSLCNKLRKDLRCNSLVTSSLRT